MIGKKIKEKYEITKHLAESHLYEVFLGTDLERNATVAIKFIRKELVNNIDQVKRFTEEIACFAKLSHPAVVQIFDIDIDGNRPFVVSEYVLGQDLRSWARGSEKVSFKNACKAIQQIGSVLHYAHQEGVVNRGVKLSNVIWTKDGAVKIISFSLPRLRLVSNPDSTVGVQSDLFFLGITFFELLTGESPIQKRGGLNESWSHQLRHFLRIHHQDLSPDRIETVTEFIERALTKNIAGRYQDHSNFLMKLADLIKTCCGSEKIGNLRPIKRLDTASAVVDAIRGQSGIMNSFVPPSRNFPFTSLKKPSEPKPTEMAGKATSFVSDGYGANHSTENTLSPTFAMSSGGVKSSQALASLQIFEEQETPERPVFARPILQLIHGGKAVADSLIWRSSDEMRWYRSPLVALGSGIFLMLALVFFW
ncbi:serine/threonine protein kinase [bacterium]|nr:serine/threonine protein kinase [bacterium]